MSSSAQPSAPADRVNPRPWVVLRERNFALLWTGQAVSTLGDQIFPVAVTVAALNAGATATQLGFILGARFVSLVLFALIGGVWADRLPRRWVMMSADGLRATAVIALIIAPTHQPIWLLSLLVFFVGAGEAFFRPAETALLPSILRKDLLAPANALNSITYRAMGVVGPALGGLVVATVGVRWAYGIDALSFIVSMTFVFFVHEPVRAALERLRREPFWTELADGFREVRRHAWVGAILLMAMVMLMATIAPTNVLLPIISREQFHTNFVYTTALALFGLGGVLGALLASFWQPRKRGLYGLLLGLPFALIPLALAFSTTQSVIWATYFVAGFGFEPFSVWWSTALQQEIDPDRLARVSSIDWMTSLALLPLGLALTGPLVAAVGQTPVLVGGAIIFVVANLVVLLVPGMIEWRDPQHSPSAA
jgi:MFS family permease